MCLCVEYREWHNVEPLGTIRLYTQKGSKAKALEPFLVCKTCSFTIRTVKSNPYSYELGAPFMGPWRESPSRIRYAGTIPGWLTWQSGSLLTSDM